MTIMEADHAEDIRELKQSRDAHSRTLRKMWDHFDERFNALDKKVDSIMDSLAAIAKRLP